MHVAITGASSGIGEALARELARHGADVTLVARRRERLDAIAAELPTKSFVVAQDLSQPARSADWIDAAEAALGPIDVMVSNAGFLTLGAVAEFDPDEAERLVNLNLLTPMRIIRAVLPKMLARRSGVIVNVTSMAAWVTLPGWIYQSASKVGSAEFSEALRREVAGSGVHVMTVYPGATDTPMTQAGLEAYGGKGLTSKIPLGNVAEMASRVRRAIARRRARLFYPRFYGVVRWFPRISRWFSALFAPKLPARRP
jgi:short-subunit dehydrogenase